MPGGGGRSEWERRTAAQRREAERQAKEQARLAREREKAAKEAHLLAQQGVAEAKSAAVEQQVRDLDEVLASALPRRPVSFSGLTAPRRRRISSLARWPPGILRLTGPTSLLRIRKGWPASSGATRVTPVRSLRHRSASVSPWRLMRRPRRLASEHLPTRRPHTTCRSRPTRNASPTSVPASRHSSLVTAAGGRASHARLPLRQGA